MFLIRARHLMDEWLSAQPQSQPSSMQNRSEHARGTSQQLLQSQSRHVHPPSASPSLWQKPQPGRVKCNIDASSLPLGTVQVLGPVYAMKMAPLSLLKL